eukprot:SAG11_NODE_108_length_16386_cov_20.828329_16_plen_31_part_00
MFIRVLNLDLVGTKLSDTYPDRYPGTRYSN